MNIELNIDRLRYLLSSYKMTDVELLDIVNDSNSSKPLKNPYSLDDVFNESADIKVIKKIDKFFNKGLSFYIDPTPIFKTKEASIFFRKDFGDELNLEARKIVAEYESLKLSISATCKLSDINLNRELPCYSIKDNPREVATKIRELAYPRFTKNKRNFLKAFIDKLSANNIFVFEFIVNHKKKAKPNIDGFFLNPNVIVIKRTTYSREILTLAHELGHLLLNKEEVEAFDCVTLNYKELDKIEKWCYDFAFHFLLGDYYNEIDKIGKANASNDYYHDLIEKIANNTNMSRLALFTNLLFANKILPKDYAKVKAGLMEDFEMKKELRKAQGGTPRPPKPIESQLFVNSLKIALYSGVVNEFDIFNIINRAYKTTDYQHYL